MKALVLTNPNYQDFISREIGKYYGNHTVYAYWGGMLYPFDFGEEYDVGISFMYQHKVPAEQVNRHPWFNFHPAPLPEYKGRNLCYHAIMNGEKEFGATLHYMDENFDTGDIIHVGKFAIEDWMTAEDVSSLALTMSESLFTWFLPRILAGEDFLRYPNRHSIYYKKEPISDVIEASPLVKNLVRAITYKEYCPKINIGGVMYKIVKE